MDKLVPSKFATTRYNQPWITRQIKRLSRWKQQGHTKAKKSGRECYWKRYKKLKKQCQDECRTAYSTYIAEMIVPDMDSNPKKFWSFIKSKRNDKTGVALIKDEYGFTYSEPAAKVEILNRQFSSVFTSDESSHDLPDKGPGPHGSMGRITVTTHGVYKLLDGIKVHKATGPDGIPGRLLKELASNLAPIFTTLYQASFDQGRVPSDWKMVFVTPIFKKGNRSKCRELPSRVANFNLLQIGRTHHPL